MRWAIALVGLTMVAGLAGCPDDGVPQTDDDSTGADAGTTVGATSMMSMTLAADGDTETSSGGSIDTWSEPSTGDSGDSGTTGSGTGTGTGTGTGSESSGGTETTGGVMGGACESDADCVLVDDCCACTAAHVDDDVTKCDAECKATTCEASGIPMHPVECRFGTCQLADVDCNQDLVQCDVPPPGCPDGQLPSVEAGCWTNDCVPAEACNTVPDCSWCGPDETCVGTGTQLGLFSSCEPIDPSCDGMPSCACMGQVCTNPFMCADGPGEDPLSCFCPVCG